MDIKTDKEGNILAWNDADTMTTGVSGSMTILIDQMEWETVEAPEDFIENWMHYRYYKGKWIRDDEAIEAKEKEARLNELRERREIECFSFVNRGMPWYELLTSAQKEELNKWYQDWLNVTETEIVPVPPDWL